MWVAGTVIFSKFSVKSKFLEFQNGVTLSYSVGPKNFFPKYLFQFKTLLTQFWVEIVDDLLFCSRFCRRGTPRSREIFLLNFAQTKRTALFFSMRAHRPG